tara:strand:- start:519 stop:623 length:105 start_codon:yes stop_codon:yes gene_type:complete
MVPLGQIRKYVAPIPLENVIFEIETLNEARKYNL